MAAVKLPLQRNKPLVTVSVAPDGKPRVEVTGGSARVRTLRETMQIDVVGIRLLVDEDIAGRAPDFADDSPKPEHGRRERRSIWVSGELNGYLDFPGVGQVFAVRRETVEVQVRQAPLRERLRRYQPDPQGRITGTPARAQSRALDDRGDRTTSSTGASTRIEAASAQTTGRRFRGGPMRSTSS